MVLKTKRFLKKLWMRFVSWPTVTTSFMIKFSFQKGTILLWEREELNFQEDKNKE